MEFLALAERTDQKEFPSLLLFGPKNRLESAGHALLKIGGNTGKGVLGSFLSEVATAHLCFIGYSSCGRGDRTGKILLELLM